MRINVYLAGATGLSRRAADEAVIAKRVRVNGKVAVIGQIVGPADPVTLDGKPLALHATATTIMLNKPPGYVCSRAGQGSRTIYDLLPPDYHRLKPIGRLDKDSSGLLLLTDDGALANRLAHPSHGKQKVYQVVLDKPLSAGDRQSLEKGVELDDGTSQLRLSNVAGDHLTARLSEGRNRQIRRSFAALGYTVTGLHRTHFGDYQLGSVPSGKYKSQA